MGITETFGFSTPGETMKTNISYHQIAERQPIVHEVRRQGTKLQRHLKKFDPDLVDLRVSLARRVRPQTVFLASLTLYLPSTQLHAREEGGRPVTALKGAFAELLRELKTFKAKLRGEDKLRHTQRRRRARSL